MLRKLVQYLYRNSRAFRDWWRRWSIQDAIADGADMVVARNEAGALVLVPGTKEAADAMAERFGDWYDREFGGYVLPELEWKEHYDALHHGGFPRAAWI